MKQRIEHTGHALRDLLVGLPAAVFVVGYHLPGWLRMTLDPER